MANNSLSCLLGIRALACLTVVVFHCLCITVTLLPDRLAYTALDKYLVLQVIMALGPASVDVFLILTGFLAARQLMLQRQGGSKHSALAKGSPSVLLQFYWKRIIRIVPAYYFTLYMLPWLVLPGEGLHSTPPEAQGILDLWYNKRFCPEHLWANFAFVQTIAFTHGGCGMPFWTLAVQMHFWLAFPLILIALRPTRPGFRRRVITTMILLTVTSTILRGLLTHHYRMALPLPWAGAAKTPDRLGPRFGAWLTTVYMGTLPRMTNLAAGVLLACWFSSKRAVKWAQQHAGRLSSSAILASAVLLLHMAYNKANGPYPDLITLGPFGSTQLLAHCWSGGVVLSAALWLTLMVIIGQVGPFGRGCHQMLSHRAWASYADASYSIFLQHGTVLYLVVRYILPVGSVAQYGAEPLALGAACLGIVLVTWLVGFVQHHVVEVGSVTIIHLLERLCVEMLTRRKVPLRKRIVSVHVKCP